MGIDRISPNPWSGRL